MKYILLLLFTALIIVSCERSEPVAEVAYCSETRVNAPCENKEEKCYKGKCIALTSKCGGDTDAFCELGKECQKDDLTQNYSCVEGRCRKSNPDGYCVKENMVCIQGACSYPCSTEHPEGACEESAKSCFNGICIESNNQCGNNNPNGLCQENHKCAKEDNEEYKCLRVCSKDFPGGPCLNDEQTCVEGVCLHRDNLCEDKENGECPTGKICLDKTCVYECSESSIDGKCKNDESFICVQGNCEERCSQTAPTGYCSGEYAGCQNGLCKKSCGTEEGEDIDGYCSNNYWCKEGVCTMPCDVHHKNGFCKDEDQWCNDGLCTNHCGQENGECQGENIICKDDGTCAEWCSSTYPAGECQENHVCQNNTCILATCGEQFPRGFCSEPGKNCVDGDCKSKCSSTTPSGWCEREGDYCYQKSCKASTQIPCSHPKGSYCSGPNYECVENECVLELCEIGFAGRCEQEGYICNKDTGICEEPPVCSDLRPILCKDGELPAETGCILSENLPNSSTFGACCSDDFDCGGVDADNDGIADNTFITDNKCIDDASVEGAFCNKIGQTACSSDIDCNNPYSEITNAEYYCSIYTEKETNYNISFCERVKANCQRDNRIPGSACNENCGNSECLEGTYCIDGVCTIGCSQEGGADECFSMYEKALECANYSGKKIYPGYRTATEEFSVYASICRNTCKSNNDCPLNENECNQYFNLSTKDINSPYFLTCGKKIVGKESKEICSSHKECSSGICIGLNGNANSGKCGTRPCSEHEDCGNNAYCDHSLSLGSIYIGMCVDLIAPRGEECTSTSTCPQGVFTINNVDKKYSCISLSDKDDVARGICGIPEIIGTAANEGGPCNRNNKYCQSGLCLGPRGSEVCREFCSQTSECSEVNDKKQICQRVKQRNATTTSDANREVYVSACIPTTGLPSLADCRTTPCSSSDETCILNAVNSSANPDKPWLFGVEYLCVNKSNGALNGATCNSNNDCQSNLCSKLSDKCTVACTLNSQCIGVGAGGTDKVCNLESYINNDNNPENWILGGTCE